MMFGSCQRLHRGKWWQLAINIPSCCMQMTWHWQSNLRRGCKTVLVTGKGHWSARDLSKHQQDRNYGMLQSTRNSNNQGRGWKHTEADLDIQVSRIDLQCSGRVRT